ncbi:MAG: hypothetical protein LBI92_04180 [Azoarcus sp.]|nr:hypothetical protein [Azoarcus sp.]
MVGDDLLVRPAGTDVNTAADTVTIKNFQNYDLGIVLGNRLTTDPARFDQIYASTGNDIIDTLDQDDVVIAGDGNDIIHAGTGNDIIWGEWGNDIIYGEDGLDYLDGETGNDLIYGGNGADLIEGGAGNDILYADNGPEDLAQAAASGQGDWLDGGAGDDTLNGSARNDFLAGGAGNDILRGGAGNDVLTGDGEYRPFYQFDYYEVIDLTGLQMQIELNALLATLGGMASLPMDVLYTLSQLQNGETFLPPIGSGKVGAIWTCHVPTAAYPRGYWERTAPTYQLSPKPLAHTWTVTHDGNGGFTLMPQLARDASQFIAAAAGGGDDYLEGGKGNDTLYGGVDNDYLFDLHRKWYVKSDAGVDDRSVRMAA